MITADGCWADLRVTRAAAQGRPCLFLDRDGVLIEDTGYPHRPADVTMVRETVALVGAAGVAGYVTGVVTNQSGLARGMFGWDAFSRVQDVIDAALAVAGAALDFVLACPYHADAVVPQFRSGTHAWRKPAPGMMVAVRERLGVDLARSIMVGDRDSDMKAAAAAGIPHRWLLGEAAASVPDVSVLSRSAMLDRLRTMPTPGADRHPSRGFNATRS